MKKLLIFITFFLLSCTSDTDILMKKAIDSTPYGIIDSTNLFSDERLDSIRYYIVNPYDSNKIESIYEKAVRHSLRNNTTVVRVDSIQYANMIIKI